MNTKILKKDVARFHGISSSMLSDIIKGRSNLGISKARKIKEQRDIPLDDLLHESGEHVFAVLRQSYADHLRARGHVING